jgi:hypothetical protein
MRALLFVISFTTGVTLMLLSGYVPRGAAARDGAAARNWSATEDRSVRPRAGRIWSPSLSGGEPETGQPDGASVAEPAEEWASSSEDSPTMIGEEPASSSSAESAPEARDDAGADAEASEHVMAAPLEAAPTAVAAEVPPEPPADEPVDAGTPAPTTPPPVADAGPDRVVWNGWDELTLDARGSHGDDLLYEWRQVGGPTPITFADPYAARTKASGLVRGPGAGWLPLLYQFELIVIDTAGREASDLVEIVAIAAPELSVRPAATRAFENRDGYWLGHYTAHVVAMADVALFEISAPTQLVFTHVGALDVEVSTVSTGETNTYEIVVYRGGDESASQTEFLVDTDEQIPGVLRLSVSWEGP